MFTVIFKNEDGTELQSGPVAYGETPKYIVKTPTKPATAQYTYTFASWTPTMEPVTGEATYTATFGETTNTYAIHFSANGGDGTMGPVTLEWGTLYELPTCEFTAPQGHAFKCWLVKGDFEVAKHDFGLIAHAIAEDTQQMLNPKTTIVVHGAITLEAQWQELPQTGDSSRMALWFALLGMASAAMFMLKKRTQN